MGINNEKSQGCSLAMIHSGNAVGIFVDVGDFFQGVPCTECEACGPNLWICLDKNCLYTGCSEQYNDHSTKHFKVYLLGFYLIKLHFFTLNAKEK